ncbi:MAG: CopG family antitoxin [Thiolinea sp.]
MDQKKYHDFDYELDAEEIALLEASERGELQPVADMDEEIAQLKKAAENVAGLGSRSNVSLRIPDYNLSRLKAQAVREGIPYQTLINSVIHQYLNGTLKRV